MRDIALSLIIFSSIPFILKRPWIGVLMFVWISLMNPHKFAFGFAFDFPFVAVVAVATLLGMSITKDTINLPLNAITFLLTALPVWMSITYLFALEPEAGFSRWIEVLKVFFFVLVTASLLNSRKHIELLLWVVVISVGFYGVKGGLFTLLTGGGSKVYGPPGASYISDNNAISVALVMTIPLMNYLRMVATSNWIKRGFLVAMMLSGMAVLGSQSRGAFLAVFSMLVFLFGKSQKKLTFGLMLFVLFPLAIGFMPESWTERMHTIQTYEQDTSAMGRMNSWHMAINLANDRPLVGGGFEPYSPKTFAMYAPDPLDVHSAHSVLFQMLGEHGYVGLGLFLALGIVAWFYARRTIAASCGRPEYAWAGDMARAIQVSLIGFAIGGLFVNISYWELQYYEIVVLMVVYRLVKSNERMNGSESNGKPIPLVGPRT